MVGLSNRRELLKYGFGRTICPGVPDKGAGGLLAQVCQNEGSGIKPTARKGRPRAF